MKAFVALLALALSCVPPASAQQPAQAPTSVRLSICTEPSAAQREWRNTSLVAIARILSRPGRPVDRARRAPCNDTMPDATCVGLPGELFCRQSALDRIHAAAAWYALSAPSNGDISYDFFRYARPLAVGVAFRFADGSSPEAVLARGLEQLRLRAEAAASGAAPADAGLAARTIRLHDRIVAFSMMALIGHESAHVDGESCVLATPSSAEASGLFLELTHVQTTNALFTAANPDPNELRADRCAARLLTQLSLTSPLAPGEEEFARRVSADLIAFQALTGFRRATDAPVGAYPILEGLDAYLRPALRIMLLSASVSPPGTRPALCGEAAMLFVHAVQEGTRRYAGEGTVSDALLAPLPPGIEASWNGAPWTPQSASCAPL